MIAALLVIAFALPSGAATYDRAKTAYDAADFERAASEFTALLDTDPKDAALNFDLGNSFYKSGKLGRASAAFQRAFDLDPRDTDIRHNLDFVLKQAGEELSPPGIPGPAFAAFTALSARELAGLHWIAAWITMILAGFFFLSDAARRRDLLNWLYGSASAWLLFGLWWAGLKAILPPGRGVIVASRAELRNGPGEKFSVGYTAPAGRRVRVLSENGPWLEIGLMKEGVKGWTLASSVEKL